MQPAVLSLENPVTFFRENNQPRRHSAALQDLECSNALTQRYPEVLFPDRDERWRLKRARVSYGALVAPLTALLPDRDAHAKLTVEPAVVRPVLRLIVDRARMNHQAFELFRVAVEPVHQVPAIARARGRLPALVDEWILSRRLLDRLQDLLCWPAQNVPLDIVRELLAKPGRTCVVSLEEHVARRRQHVT